MAWRHPEADSLYEEEVDLGERRTCLGREVERLRSDYFQKAAERGGYGTERYEKLEFQKRVQEYYYALRDSSWEVADGCLKMEAVDEKLRELAMNCILKCQNGKPLVNIWSGN